MRIVVTGSLAYDYIMNFPGYFKDHILPEKAHIISVSFLVDSMKRMRGGVAGNIAYNLAMLGEQPLVFSIAGSDFEDYNALLRARGVDTSQITIVPDEFTASCFITTDSADNQIVAFYPGSMSLSPQLSLHGIGLSHDDLVLVSSSDPASMDRVARECQELGIPYIFDAGKQAPRLTAEHLRTGLRGTQILIGNDYEFGMMAKTLDITEAELIASVPTAVVTLGERGSLIYTSATNGQGMPIPVVPVANVIDPTGAGDAFLSGFVVGLKHNMPLDVAGRMGALASAYVLEQRGCQEHNYTLAEFVARYAAVFGPNEHVARLAADVATVESA